MVIVAVLLAGAAAWLAVPGRRKGPKLASTAPRHTLSPPGSGWSTERGRSGRSRRGWFGPRRTTQSAVQHVRALRQLASLLRSGRTPAEAWALLEETWLGQTPGTRSAKGTSAQQAPTDAGAAQDIVAACRAARSANEMGSAPSLGLERHLGTCPPEYGAAWARLVWCVRLSEATGAALSDLLDRLAGQLEAGEDRRLALESALAGPRATQRMLAWLPAFGLGLAQLIGAEPLAVLTLHPVGRLCMLAGALLWWANRAWGRRLLESASFPGRRTR